MHLTRIFLSAIGILGLPLSISCQVVDESPAACVRELQIPQYPIMAWAARTAAHFEARIEVAVDGSIRRIAIEPSQSRGAQQLLRRAIESAMQSSVFDQACYGKAIRLSFRFELRGDSSPAPNLSVRLRFPNEVLLIANPPPIMEPNPAAH